MAEEAQQEASDVKLEPIMAEEAQQEGSDTELGPIFGTASPAGGAPRKKVSGSKARDCWGNPDEAERLEAQDRLEESRVHRKHDAQAQSVQKQRQRTDMSFARGLREKGDSSRSRSEELVEPTTAPVRDCWANVEDTERLEAQYRLAVARKHRQAAEEGDEKGKRSLRGIEHRQKNRLDSPRSPRSAEGATRQDRSGHCNCSRSGCCDAPLTLHCSTVAIAGAVERLLARRRLCLFSPAAEPAGVP